MFHLSDRFYASSVRNLVDFHNDFDIVLHGQFDCVFDFVKVYASY